MDHLQFTGTEIARYVGLLLGVLFLGVVWAKYRLRRSTAHSPQTHSPTRHRTKYAYADTWRRSGTHFRIGLAVAVALAVLAINWTTFEERAAFELGELGIDEALLIVPPPTAYRPPPPPPPPPPPKEIVVEEDPVEQQPDFTDTSIDINEPVAVPPPVAAAAPPPPPPPPPVPEPDIDELFITVERMPRFAGCEEEVDRAAAKTCSEKALFGFLRKHLTYPPIAKDNDIQGTVVLQFIVEKDGSISDLTVMRGKSGGLTEEAMRVVKLMPDWQPGQQNGRPVRVKYTLPIKFKLQ